MPTQPSDPPLHRDQPAPHSRVRALAIVLAVMASLVAPLWHLHIINRNMPPNKSDLQAVRFGVQATLHGRNPYSDATTRQIQTAYYGRPLTPADQVNKMAFAYPATTAIVLAVLAPLSWDQARWAFLLLMPLLTAASVLLWLNIAEIKVSRDRALLITALTLTSWPVMWAFRLQQPTLVVALLLAASCFLLKHGSGVTPGILLALATIKPQLAGPVIAWLLLWAIVHHRWRFVVSFAATTTLLLAGAEVIVPGWLAPWHTAGVELLQYTHQQPALQSIFGHRLGTSLIFAIAIACSAILWRLRRCNANAPEFGMAIALALAVTVALLPTDVHMIYNDVLLLPAVLILFHIRPTGDPSFFARLATLMAVGWNFAACPIAILGESITHPSNFWDGIPFQAPLLPILATVALVIITGPRLQLYGSLALIPQERPSSLAT